jgi:hypothetical protein
LQILDVWVSYFETDVNNGHTNQMEN